MGDRAVFVEDFAPFHRRGSAAGRYLGEQGQRGDCQRWEDQPGTMHAMTLSNCDVTHKAAIVGTSVVVEFGG